MEKSFSLFWILPTKRFASIFVDWIPISKRKRFLGALSLIFAVSSFYRPSIAEIKHVSSLSRKEFFGNVLIVIVFSAILALLFVGYDALIELVLNLFK